jgi:uncharacterized protein involved in exopolysaccharide biosynthesis
MSVEFRQRTAGELIRMLKRRKWLIILPVITMTAAIGYVVYKLPSVYESRTLLTVKPPTISEKVVNRWRTKILRSVCKPLVRKF